MNNDSAPYEAPSVEEISVEGDLATTAPVATGPV